MKEIIERGILEIGFIKANDFYDIYELNGNRKLWLKFNEVNSTIFLRDYIKNKYKTFSYNGNDHTLLFYDILVFFQDYLQ